jgi:hypothetical protein
LASTVDPTFTNGAALCISGAGLRNKAWRHLFTNPWRGLDGLCQGFGKGSTPGLGCNPNGWTCFNGVVLGDTFGVLKFGHDQLGKMLIKIYYILLYFLYNIDIYIYIIIYIERERVRVKHDSIVGK